MEEVYRDAELVHVINEALRKGYRTGSIKQVPDARDKGAIYLKGDNLPRAMISSRPCLEGSGIEYVIEREE